ncbi:MAG: hypothetical protein V1793_23330 [Pseudomonadota bacterium]
MKRRVLGDREEPGRRIKKQGSAATGSYAGLRDQGGSAMPMARQGAAALTPLPVKKRRSPEDRRTGEDRRKIHDPDVLDMLGMDRRRSRTTERRENLQEKRNGWVRVSQWSSLCVDPGALFY